MLRMQSETKNSGYQHIGDIAERLGVSARTIRYYEELGLIVPTRSNGGFREYSEAAIEKLSTILRLKKLGLPLESIQKFANLGQCAVDKKSAAELLEHLHERLHEFEEKISEFKKMKNEIGNMINIMEKCLCCKEPVKLFKCETCAEKDDKKIPPIMKAML